MFRPVPTFFSVALLLLTGALHAATPASGTISDAETTLTWTGTAPFVFPNVTPASGEPQCVAEPLACDKFALTVDISEKYRADEKTKKERVSFTVSWPNASGAGDFDVYFRDASGALVADAATSANPETIVVPVSALKNGNYVFEVIPFLPLGENYETVAQLGKAKAAGTKSFDVSPAVVAVGETVTFDARALSGTLPSGGYRFDFGDGASATDMTGVVEHRYASDGNYLARVSFADANNSKGAATAAQTVVVSSAVAGLTGKSGGGLVLGAFGIPVLFSLFGLALLRRRIH